MVQISDKKLHCQQLNMSNDWRAVQSGGHIIYSYNTSTGPKYVRYLHFLVIYFLSYFLVIPKNRLFIVSAPVLRGSITL